MRAADAGLARAYAQRGGEDARRCDHDHRHMIVATHARVHFHAKDVRVLGGTIGRGPRRELARHVVRVRVAPRRLVGAAVAVAPFTDINTLLYIRGKRKYNNINMWSSQVYFDV